MTVPQITIEQANFLWHWDVNLQMSRVNKAIDEYNTMKAEREAELSQEQPLITAEEARKLGAGNVEIFDTGFWVVCDNFPNGYQYRAIKQAQPSEASTEQYITAEEAIALDKSSVLLEYYSPEFGCWMTCNYLLRFNEKFNNGEVIKYRRAIKQPAPAEPHAELKAMYAQQVKDGALDNFVWEYKNTAMSNEWREVAHNLGVFYELNQYRCTPKPTCQVRNLDTGELKTMTREAAKLLQAELGDTVEWRLSGVGCVSNHNNFETTGTYSYKLKANLVKLNGKLVTREAVIAEYESKKDTCDLWVKNRSGAMPCVGPLWYYFEKHDQHEYELRERPLKQISWKDVPAGVAVLKVNEPNGSVFKAPLTLSYGGNTESKAMTKNGRDAIWITNADLELAPADQQTKWLSVQDEKDYGVDKVEGLIYLWRSNHSYKIVGITKGWELK